MKRGGPIKRTVPLRSYPKKAGFDPKPTKAEQDAEWEAAREAALRRDLFSCQARRLGIPDPCRFGVQVHHILPRGRGGTHDLDNLLSLCLVHHMWVHSYQIKAKELGALR